MAAHATATLNDGPWVTLFSGTVISYPVVTAGRRHWSVRWPGVHAVVMFGGAGEANAEGINAAQKIQDLGDKIFTVEARQDEIEHRRTDGAGESAPVTTHQVEEMSGKVSGENSGEVVSN